MQIAAGHLDRQAWVHGCQLKVEGWLCHGTSVLGSLSSGQV